MSENTPVSSLGDHGVLQSEAIVVETDPGTSEDALGAA